METKIIPLREQIVVLPLQDSVTRGGIHLPNNVQSVVQKAEVLAVGTARHYAFGTMPMETKVGDIVFYPDGAGFEIDDNGTMLRVLPETSIIAVLKKEGK